MCSRRKGEFRLEEGVVEVEEVDMSGALYKLAVGQLRRVKMTVLLEHLAIKPDVTRI